LLVALGCLSACTGSEVGNPVKDVRVALTAHSSDDAVAFLGGDAGATAALTVDELWVSLGDMRFVLDDDCSADRDTRISVPGPITADLARAPTALVAKLQDGAYCRVRVPLGRAIDDGAIPAELVGHSTLLIGQRDDGVRFTIRSRDKPALVVRSRDEPFPIDDERSPLILAFDAGRWLAGIDLGAVAPNADGEIVIDASNEQALLGQFETNLRTSLALFRDGNANGRLEQSEADEPLAF
jgi:hypothetical protein